MNGARGRIKCDDPRPVGAANTGDQMTAGQEGRSVAVFCGAGNDAVLAQPGEPKSFRKFVRQRRVPSVTRRHCNSPRQDW